MPWIKEIIYAGKTAEVAYKFAARFGKKGTPRKNNENLTSQKQIEINQRRSERTLRILLNHNFSPGDYYLTLTYTRENRPSPERAAKDLKNYLKRLRTAYRKAGLELKYITVTEYANKAIHHHLVINAIDIQLLPNWKRSTRRRKIGEKALPLESVLAGHGHLKIQMLDDTGDYTALANYLVKETSKTFLMAGSPSKKRWNPSRSLTMPKKHVTILKTARWAKDPKPPEGYYIVKNSIRSGLRGDQYEYLEYTAILLKSAKRRIS